MRATRKEGCISRVCACCNQSFYIGKDNISDAIYYDKKTYHSNCFIDKQVKSFAPKEVKNSKTMPKNDQLLEYGIDIQKYKSGRRYIPNGKDKILHDFNEAKKKQYEDQLIDFHNRVNDITNNILNSGEFIQLKKNSYNHFLRSIEKQCVYDFILEVYDLNIIPTNIWEKITEIYSGTYKGMSIGIPPEHLLDMWKRKIDMLNGVAERNEIKGIKMSADQRLNYDLSILVNKYDSYLKWLEKQKIIASEKEIEKNDNIVGKSIGYTASNKSGKNDSDDISALVDDIFG